MLEDFVKTFVKQPCRKALVYLTWKTKDDKIPIDITIRERIV